MRICVIRDLEGISGVVDHRNRCWPDGAHFAQARRMATMELNALVEGALAGGATEITAWDGHSCGFPSFLDTESLHPECRLIVNAGDGGPPALDRSIEPWSPPPPYRLRVKYREERFAEEIAARQGVERLDGLTVEMERESIEQLAF